MVVVLSVRSNEVGDAVRLVLRFRRGRRSLCAPAALLSLVNPSEEGIVFFFRRGRSDGGAKAPVSILFAVKVYVCATYWCG